MRSAAALLPLLLLWPSVLGLNVLFIGNGQITANNLPKLVKKLAGEVGVSVSTTTITCGGCSCEDHCNTQDARLFSNTYDVVVIQEQTARHAFPVGEVYYQSLPYCQSLVDAIRTQGLGDPEFVILEMWPYQNGDPNNCVELGNGDILGFETMCSFEDMRVRMSASARTAAYLATPAKMAPCGIAANELKSLNRGTFDKKLYQNDGISPRKEMSYMCAYTLTPQVIGQSIKKKPKAIKNVKGKIRKRLKKAADKALAKNNLVFTDTSATSPCGECIDANA